MTGTGPIIIHLFDYFFFFQDGYSGSGSFMDQPLYRHYSIIFSETPSLAGIGSQFSSTVGKEQHGLFIVFMALLAAVAVLSQTGTVCFVNCWGSPSRCGVSGLKISSHSQTRGQYHAWVSTTATGLHVQIQ